MNKVLTTIAISLSALIATSAMAAPQHDARFQTKPPAPAHWNDNGKHSNYKDQHRYNQKHINPSRDWRVGERFPRMFDSNRYKVDYRDTRHLSKPSRNQSWYKVNGDYVLVNTKNEKIIRIV